MIQVAMPEETTQPSLTVTKGRVLVIDDELGPRESIRFLFKDEYEVLCANCMDQGVTYLRDNRPDVVILDIKMPGKSGIDGLLDLRAIDPNVSIVMLTGFGSLKTAQQAMRNGANDYIRKPFDTREMRDTVNHYIDRTRVARRHVSASENLCALNARMREELAEKEHLADVGRLSSEFVHDLRSPLTVIYGYVSLLMAELDTRQDQEGASTAETAEYLSIIEKNVQRCEQMLTQWRQSREQDTSEPRRRLNLPVILRELADNARSLAAGANAEVNFIPPSQSVDVVAQETDLYRALQNLVTNAIQALPGDGGRIEISMSVEDDAAAIRIKDDGPGIPADQMQQVLALNYTTKKEKGGMGLGLFITANIIETHGGQLELINNPDKGLTALVRLPVAKPREGVTGTISPPDLCTTGQAGPA